MDYLGKTVRLKPEFIEKLGASDENGHLKLGTVIDQQHLGSERTLLIVDDRMFGTWKAVNSNILVVQTH